LQRHRIIPPSSLVIRIRAARVRMGKRKAKIGGYGRPGKLDIVFDEQARK
jgi:hypothetical protein